MIDANPHIAFIWYQNKSNRLYLTLCMDMSKYIDWEKQDLNFIRYMIDHACIGGNSTETAYRIIVEESGGYFAGDKAVADVAEVIQSCVDPLLHE